MKLAVYDIKGSEVGAVTLDGGVWEGPLNTRLLNQALAMYRNNQAQRTASTKTRGLVSGGGRKPWKQKHTGRARAGSNRSPLWRGGAVIFGPLLRDTHYRLPQTLRRKALVESLKGKIRDAELLLVEGLQAERPKTKPFAGLAGAFSVAKKSIIVLDDASDALIKSLRNLAEFEVRSAQNLNAWDVLNCQKLLMTKTAFTQLEARVRGEDAASN